MKRARQNGREVDPALSNRTSPLLVPTVMATPSGCGCSAVVMAPTDAPGDSTAAGVCGCRASHSSTCRGSHCT